MCSAKVRTTTLKWNAGIALFPTIASVSTTMKCVDAKKSVFALVWCKYIFMQATRGWPKPQKLLIRLASRRAGWRVTNVILEKINLVPNVGKMTQILTIFSSFDFFSDFAYYDRQQWYVAGTGSHCTQKCSGPKMDKFRPKLGPKWGFRPICQLWLIGILLILEILIHWLTDMSDLR